MREFSGIERRTRRDYDEQIRNAQRWPLAT
jgi:hypothetical protein